MWKTARRDLGKNILFYSVLCNVLGLQAYVYYKIYFFENYGGVRDVN